MTVYLQAMPKHIELPPRVAQAFVRDMRAFFNGPHACSCREAARKLARAEFEKLQRDI
jgi:hypothetical protein